MYNSPSFSPSSSDNVLALSSVVGRSNDQPLFNVPFAASLIVFKTPLLITNITTCCRKDCKSLLPTPRPSSAPLTSSRIAAWN